MLDQQDGHQNDKDREADADHGLNGQPVSLETHDGELDEAADRHDGIALEQSRDHGVVVEGSAKGGMEAKAAEGSIPALSDAFLEQDQEWVENVEKDHRAHVVDHVARLKADVFEVFVERVARLKLQYLVEDVVHVIEVEGCDLEDALEEDGSVRRQLHLHQG